MILQLKKLLCITATLLSIHGISSQVSAAESNDTNDRLIAKFPSLVSWFRSHGGFVDDRVTIGYEAPSKGKEDLKIRGTIASSDIPAKTLLVSCPKSLMIKSLTNKVCDDIDQVVQELKLGPESKWYPYLDFDDSLGSRLPTVWDRNSAAISELQGLPPTGETHRHLDFFLNECYADRAPEKYVGESGEEEEEVKLDHFEMKALLMYLTRAADIGLIPIYDLLNHHNGKINTYLEKNQQGDLLIYSLYDIAAGESIYNTYARSGWESTVDVFNTYGFVEDYPQTWKWSDEKLQSLHEQDKYHAYKRYATPTTDSENSNGGRQVKHDPNSHHYEILVISPTLAALAPTKELVNILGNGQRSLEDWKNMINDHNAKLRASHVRDLRDSAEELLNALPTTIEEDEIMIPDEKWRLEKVKRVGRIDVNKADRIQAIEFRLAFKKALKLAVEVAEKENFFDDSGEL